MFRRTCVVALMLVMAALYLGRVSRAEAVPARQALTRFPLTLGAWRGERAPDFDARVVKVLGVDEYINRVYRGTAGAIGLYIGYHASQRQGDSIHSPLNCLPGAGWQPIETGRLSLDVEAGGARQSIVVNRFIIQKGEDRQLVLYWYQSRGRVVASEYWGKVYLVADAIRYNRTDAALVRVISPLGRDDGAEQAAENRAAMFVRAMFPHLGGYLPI